MGSPFGLSLASVFFCYHEKIWFLNCPSELKPVIYRRCVDGVFKISREIKILLLTLK